MKSDELRALQAPLKAKYKEDPGAARITLKAAATLDAEKITCVLNTPHGRLEAGLHPATGGDGASACSGDMLLEALAACAGVTLKSVATAFGVTLKKAVVRAEGDLDFRGTLGLAKDAPVGFEAIRLSFDLESDATPEQLEKIVSVTERYCVVFQTLKSAPPITVSRP